MRLMRLALAPLWFVFLSSCTGEAAAPAGKTIPETFHLASAPANPVSVKELRAAPASDNIAVVGRVKDFAEGLAGMTLADRSLRACSDNPGDECKTPWDYCCVPQEELTAGLANVEFRDGAKVLKGSPKGFHGIDHLKEVVVVGRSEKDAQGNVTLVAKGVFVR